MFKTDEPELACSRILIPQRQPELVVSCAAALLLATQSTEQSVATISLKFVTDHTAPTCCRICLTPSGKKLYAQHPHPHTTHLVTPGGAQLTVVLA